MITIKRTFNPSGLLQVDDLRGEVFTGESGAHIFEISGVGVQLAGTVKGTFLAPNGVTIPLDGSAADGVVSMTLTEDCYVAPGRFILSIFLSSGSVTGCIYCGVGNVFRTQSDVISYPSASIPDIEQIIANAQAAAAQIQAEVTAAQAAVAAAQTAVDGIEDQRQTMIESIASVAGQGTDTTLTQSGVAADAKAAGDHISDLKSALNITDQQLTVSFTASGVRTWDLADTGMVVGQKYYLQIASYTGANTLTRVTARFYDSSTALIETVGDNLTVGSVINFIVPANAAKFRLLYYISANESASASLTVNIWQYRFQSVLDDLTNGLAAKVEGQTFGYIDSGSVNIDRTNNTITSTSLRVITSRGIYNQIPDASISFDSSTLLFVGYSASDPSHALTTYQLNFATSPDKVLLFAYQNERLYFTDQYDKITINGGKYNPINNSRVICCLGDSFTAGSNSWTNAVNKQTGYTMVNLGVAGTRMTVTYTSGSTEYKCFIDRVADGALDSYTPDLIVVFGGINDAVKLHNNQCRIGEITDTAEYSASTTSGYSFIARAKYLINLIKTKKPGVPIVGVLPPDYSEGTTDYDWWYDYIGMVREALALVYEQYGIPYVNLDTKCQEMHIDAYNLSTYRINGLSNMHPSTAGSEAIGKTIYQNGIKTVLWG